MDFIETAWYLKPAPVLVTLFFAILFLQSGFDKVIDWKGNRSYIKSVFAKTPLASFTPILFPVITLLECLCGLICLAGTLEWLFYDESSVALYGIELSAVTLLMLFFGQRVAKDYAGAAGIVPYFIVSLIGVLLLTGF